MVKNKKFIILALLSLLLIPMVFATADSNPLYNIVLKSNITGFAGNVLLFSGNQVQVIGVNVPKGEKYTLVYLEDKNIPAFSICDRRTPSCQIRPGASKYSSTRFPKVKCIMQGIEANGEGLVSKTAAFNYLNLASDKKNEKIYVVQSKDVKCIPGTMLHWNPSQYFEGKDTI